MENKGLILDLENIILFCENDPDGENRMIYNFLLERKYVFHPDDLLGLSPGEYAEKITKWRGKDKEILAGEVGKFQRQVLVNAKYDPSGSGVFQALAAKFTIAVVSTSRGDGIVKALANAGVRSYINFIVPKENWANGNVALAIDAVLAKFPKIPTENWVYVGCPHHRDGADNRGVRFLPYGTPPLTSLEDLMDELL